MSKRSKRTLVASWDAKRPKGSELRRERPEYKDPQRWLVVVSITQPDGAKDTHSIKADQPCALANIFEIAERSIQELCRNTPTVTAARMEFYA